MKLRAATAAKR